VIDFSDNDIKKLDNFPQMQRLNALIVNNNSVTRIGAGLAEHLPKLATVILTNNRLANMSEIDRLAECKLESLSLLDNPIVAKSQYRLYVIYKIPTLKWLDFRKVQQTEREESAKFFKTPAGKAFLGAVAQEAKFLSEGGGAGGAGGAVQLTEEQKAMVKRAIEAATTKEEIDLIERQLKVRRVGSLHVLLRGSGACCCGSVLRCGCCVLLCHATRMWPHGCPVYVACVCGLLIFVRVDVQAGNFSFLNSVNGGAAHVGGEQNGEKMAE
jgi:U2 small nuclear ribonucleoprotein A'